jgi:hypothetical protein
MTSKQEFNQPVGQVIQTNSLNQVNHHHYHSKGISKEQEQINHAVSKLMLICTKMQCKEEIEQISQALFGSSLFKKLSLNQIASLQRIAEVTQHRLSSELEKWGHLNSKVIAMNEVLSKNHQQIERLEHDLAEQTQFAEQPCDHCQQHANLMRYFGIGALIAMLFLGLSWFWVKMI